jgi:hypothetical protein
MIECSGLTLISQFTVLFEPRLGVIAAAMQVYNIQRNVSQEGNARN